MKVVTKLTFIQKNYIDAEGKSDIFIAEDIPLGTDTVVSCCKLQIMEYCLFII